MTDEDLRDPHGPESTHNPDFVALGLGGTNMMAMLWTLAMGRSSVGVELRGDPGLGVHWNIREDLFHQLGLIDRMMLEEYGEDGVPRRGDGRTLRLAECFYGSRTTGGDVSADEIVCGFDQQQHLAGSIYHIEFIDDRWKDGAPHRVVSMMQGPQPDPEPDPSKIRTRVADVLSGPSTFQAGASEVLVLLRRYLEAVQAMDLARGIEPRVRIYTQHRVVPDEGDGFIDEPDGRKRIRIEPLQELDHRGTFVRTRRPGAETIDIGVPELFVIAEGASSSDAERLGFTQRDVLVDHQDGRGPVVAQADFLAGLVGVLVDGRLRRRISSEFDEEGNEYWVRQLAVGHEGDPEVGWIMVQVPDFKTFDPVASQLVPAGTDIGSSEYFAAYQQLLYQFFIDQASGILEIPKEELATIHMEYGPKLFSIVERIGHDAQVAPNGVVAGDTLGNGHFLTSGGAMTGMIGHSARVLRYWQDRDKGLPAERAIRSLADTVKEDTEAWLEASATEFSQTAPVNFGAERMQEIADASGIAQDARAHMIDASRRFRHALLPLDPSDWRRLVIRYGRLYADPLPEVNPLHPAARRP
ncbi:hypothetical protein [Streptomyces sannanensis]|uniref:hypothetical protein n=1 Tax=Streptomyces sannanensis TaxID=285536 RepID=UPI0031E93AA3